LNWTVPARGKVGAIPEHDGAVVVVSDQATPIIVRTQFDAGIVVAVDDDPASVVGTDGEGGLVVAQNDDVPGVVVWEFDRCRIIPVDANREGDFVRPVLF